MLNWLYLFRSRGGLSRSEVCGEMWDLKEYTVVSKHVKLLLENVQKPSCTPLGNLAEAETSEATSTLSHGCRRSGRNPLHLWREGSQLGESEKLPVLPNRTNWNARRQKCSFDHSFCELPFCCLALWSFPLIYSPFFFFYVKKTTIFPDFSTSEDFSA